MPRMFGPFAVAFWIVLYVTTLARWLRDWRWWPFWIALAFAVLVYFAANLRA